MADFAGYMAHSLGDLDKLTTFTGTEAAEIFLKYYELGKSYRFAEAVDFSGLAAILTDDRYLVMNNEPRHRGKHVFFTANAALAKREALLAFIEAPTLAHDLIIPLFLVPADELNDAPKYIITTQEDPVFYVMVPKYA